MWTTEKEWKKNDCESLTLSKRSFYCFMFITDSKHIVPYFKLCAFCIQCNANKHMTVTACWCVCVCLCVYVVTKKILKFVFNGSCWRENAGEKTRCLGESEEDNGHKKSDGRITKMMCVHVFFLFRPSHVPKWNYDLEHNLCRCCAPWQHKK